MTSTTAAIVFIMPFSCWIEVVAQDQTGRQQGLFLRRENSTGNGAPK